MNEIGEDYGRDFEIEVFRNAKSTGISFSVQLKSSVAPAYSADGEFVSQELARPNALYLAREIRHPVLLIVADVAQQRLFWAAPQADTALLKGLRDRQDAKTCTMRVPVTNEFPAATDRLIEALGVIETFLASRRLMEVPLSDFAASVRGNLDTTVLSQALRDKSEFLDLQRADDHATGGDFEAARAIVRGVLSSDRPSTEVKFFALRVGEKVEWLVIARTSGPQDLFSRLELATGTAMWGLTRRGPRHLKFYALLARSAAEFHLLAQQDFGLYQNWKIHERDGDLWWRTGLMFERAALSRRIVRKYSQLVRLVNYAARTPYRAALPLALLRINRALAVFIARLEHEGFLEAATGYRASGLQICKFAANLAAQSAQDDVLAQSALAAALLTRDSKDECFRWASGLVETIRDQETRHWARERIRRQEQRLQGVAYPDDTYKDATGEQIYQNMAAAIGINLTDPDDLLAQMVRTAIADLNPSRVLRDCEHIFVTVRPMGLVATWLRLPTMGQKAVHCELYRYSVVGGTLDGAYQSFKNSYCEACPDRCPRPLDWRYSPQWQEAENARHKEYMDRWRGPTGPHVQPLPLPPDIGRQTDKGVIPETRSQCATAPETNPSDHEPQTSQ